jgi:hypothetical protein
MIETYSNKIFKGWQQLDTLILFTKQICLSGRNLYLWYKQRDTHTTPAAALLYPFLHFGRLSTHPPFLSQLGRYLSR